MAISNYIIYYLAHTFYYEFFEAFILVITTKGIVLHRNTSFKIIIMFINRLYTKNKSSKLFRSFVLLKTCTKKLSQHD